MRTLKIPSVALSLLIQLAPFLRVATADAALVMAPVMAVLRMFAGAAAVAGSFHAVSGATAPSLTSTKTKVGTVGVNLSYRILLSGGSPESYKAVPRSPGLDLNLIMNSNGKVTGAEIKGVPTKTGQTLTTITAWDNPGFDGDSTSGTVTFLIADIAPLTPSVAAGQSATFSVLGTQGAPVIYRWLHDDVEVPAPEGTNSFLTLPLVTDADAGQYRVRITFGNTSAFTQRATLTVLPSAPPPTITQPPSDAALHLGESLSLHSVATGEGALTYEWTKNGQPVAEQSAANLEIATVTAADAGEYRVTVTGPGGSTPSDIATVTVTDALSIGAVSLEEAGLRLPYNGITGRAYLLESRFLLDSPGWTQAAESVAGPSGAFVIPSPESDTQVYRIRSR